MLRLEDRITFHDQSTDVLAIGEMLIDMISEQYDDAVNSGTYHRFFGGSAANLAMNLKKLGLSARVASAVGKDGFGTYLLRQLEQAGVPTDCIQLTDHSTSLVVVTRSRATPSPIFYRDADFQLSFVPQLEQAVKQSKIVHFSCWPISRDPARTTVEKVIAASRREGVLVGFDPNYHPNIWNKGEDGTTYVKSIISQADVIKPSQDDADRLFGKDTPENQLAKFLDLGAKLVILTLGADGAIVSNGSERVKLDSVATNVVDATGAGDAFWSGFYAGLIRGLAVIDAIKFGMEVSAYKLKHVGPVDDFPGTFQLKQIQQSGGFLS